MQFNFGIYPVITEEFCNGRASVDILKLVIKGGARIVQLRQKLNKSDKITSKKMLYELALMYRKITKENGVILIINDHVDIALSVGADGVHLGQGDLPCCAVKKIAPNLIIGVSTHNEFEIRKAEEDGATYINIGPIFSTNTKNLAISPLGINYLESVKTKLPFSVMGGIKLHNIKEILNYGAKNIAMVTEITMADDVVKRVKNLQLIISSFSK